MDDDGDGHPEIWNHGCDANCQSQSALTVDQFPDDPDEWADSDDDGVGDNGDDYPTQFAASLDSDGDTYPDSFNNGCDDVCQLAFGRSTDAFDFDPTEWLDTDGDGIGNNADEDDDDGIPDELDVFPLDPNEWADQDRDGVGDNGDHFPRQRAVSKDHDGDTYPDAWNALCDDYCQIDSGLFIDEFPFQKSRWVDSDGDGLPDQVDLDDDNDGSLDESDQCPLDKTATSKARCIEPRRVAGDGFICELHYDANTPADPSEVLCSGRNNAGQTDVPDLQRPRALVAGRSHSCAIDDLGVQCWGEGALGQTLVPSGLASPRSLSSGDDHVCVIHDGGVACWGNNANGQSEVPELDSTPLSLALGSAHSCVLTETGVQCWGDDLVGQSSVPQELFQPNAIAAAEATTCAYDATQTLCWGAPVYDLKRDFRSDSNPFDNWSFWIGDSLMVQVPVGERPGAWVSVDGEGTESHVPYWSSAEVTDVQVEPGDIVMHTSYPGLNDTEVRWTAEEAGTVSIAAQIWKVFEYDRK